ncbi:MAG: 2-hydroxyacyl-CoA dehydratase family protein [candidate division Zixibacteria bacterium]|nr:2-hydroxyacyl-CoA dehydratase family protein [candidate division Zixibacteria bacterium]MBU1471840.1 2-hydroxyacyl-CoA dehydratase family protein [candidate division Zixibacteria bacterium]MBU2625710.1 2-hydroxyacyl-CoA dehydratase family protein [candidate division Zixibacteria bacterium]
MSDDYYQMWTDLGLDLESHDALLGILGQAYQDVYLSQKNRPRGMQYFDFVMSEVHGLRIKELLDAKRQGRPVVGAFCTFVPEEMVLAIDGVCVGLCAGAEFGFDEAERYVPRNTCSLIKSIFGFKLGKVCPYIESVDLLVGENTCDGKKKAYEILGTLVDCLYVMDLPQMKSDAGRALLKSEYTKFMAKIEEISGKEISLQNLRRGVQIANNKRKAAHRLNRLRAANPAPISGLDALLVNQVYFYDDPVRFTDSVNKICDELEDRIAENDGVFAPDTPRILISGCPMAVPNWKVPAIVEDSGAVIVGEESCVGERGTQNLVDVTADSLDGLLDSIVDRYCRIDCAIFTPNESRLDHVKQLVQQYKADGVIHYCLQFCQPYQMESGPVETALENSDIPVLRIDTDYSQEDVGQIRTRVEAFIERISAQS